MPYHLIKQFPYQWSHQKRAFVVPGFLISPEKGASSAQTYVHDIVIT